MAAQQDPPKQRCSDTKSALRRRPRGRRRRLPAAAEYGDVRANDVVHALSGGTALHAARVAPRGREITDRTWRGASAPTSIKKARRWSTALMDACEAVDLEIARELLDTYGADPHAEDRDGHTALDLAREHGHDKVAALVEDRGGLPG